LKPDIVEYACNGAAILYDLLMIGGRENNNQQTMGARAIMAMGNNTNAPSLEIATWHKITS
jgi:hypothetical protein